MRPCIYCGAPWPDRVLDIDHDPDCPSVTNLWPVLPAEAAEGFGCCRCGHVFAPDECYTTVATPDESGHTDEQVVEVLCLSCATVLA